MPTAERECNKCKHATQNQFGIKKKYVQICGVGTLLRAELLGSLVAEEHCLLRNFDSRAYSLLHTFVTVFCFCSQRVLQRSETGDRKAKENVTRSSSSVQIWDCHITYLYSNITPNYSQILKKNGILLKQPR